MSRFEVRLTPTRVTNARKRDEAREPVLVTMAPFSAKSIVAFEDIPVGKVARRVLLVENPSPSAETKILVTKTCKPEFNIALEWTSHMVGASSTRSLEIVWNPPKAVACREIIQFTNSHGFRKDVAVVLKSVETRKPTKKLMKVNNGAVTKKKMKTPTPPRQVLRMSVLSPNLVTKYKAKSPNLRKIISPQKKPRSCVKNKENLDPVTPSAGASSLFDQFRFTPVTETKPEGKSLIDYLASLPTPVAGGARIGRRIQWTPDGADAQSSLQPRQLLSVPANDELSNVRLSTETYIKGPDSRANSFEDCPVDETEHEAPIPEGQKTFDVTKRIEITNFGSRDEFTREVDNIVLTPLRKIIASESMKNLSGQNREQEYLKLNQGSMPNLHEIEKISSIESNRYFYAGAEIEENGVNDERQSVIAFHADEIRAQSSRVNLHEVETEVSPIPPKSDLFKVPPLKRNRDQLASSNVEVRSSLMTLSPPKKYRPDDVCTARASSADTLTVKTWSRYQPKKLKPLTLIKVKTPRTPQKSQRDLDTIVPLYDTKIYLHNVNLDPFAATTTCDPFLSTRIFLDDEAVERHEKHFKKWLNALVTVPEELDGADQKIDVAKLFNEVKNKELTLAPTKESVSSKYFIKYRLETLRKAALDLYKRENVRTTLEYVTVLVEKKQLTIQQNRDLHLDLALQRQILELIFCFNPLWLRIGLEVVFNEKIDLSSNRDIHGLTNFILNRLFRNKALEKKFRSYNQSNEYGTKIKKSTLKHLLHLVYLLDRAKQERIIKYNPCLFVKGAKYKESNEIMKQITSLLVTNVGDILRYLKRSGYMLEHKQTYLDEFDYAFGNLATDLRDGIRLTRVMEVILMREDLSQQLRYPAISLLQKRHNADVALSALTQADFEICGNISGKDIAEGHREKTLSLLWQIIYKFRAPKFHASATIIQRWWRSSSLKVEIRRRIAFRVEQKRHAAASVIQAAWRGVLTRRYVREYRTECIVASIVIQTYWRRYAAQKNYRNICGAAITVQRWWRRLSHTRVIRKQFLETRTAAMKIQNWYRRMQTARKLEAVAKLAHERRQEMKLMNKSARVIQKTLKSYLIRNKLRDCVNKVVALNAQKKLELNSATKIQSFWRMRRQRKNFMQCRQSAVFIQQFWRRCLLTKRIQGEFQEKRKAVIKIQCFWRGYCWKKNFLRLKNASLVFQRRFRAQRAMKQQRRDYLKLRSAAVVIQRRWSANKYRDKEQAEFLKLKTTATLIQRRFRGRKLMLQQQFEYICLKESTIVIQKFFRGYLLMKAQSAKYQALLSATKVIQTHFRANQLMKKQKEEYQRIKVSVVNVQRRFRAQGAMTVARGEFLKMKKAAVVIQTRFRATMIMRKQRVAFISYQYSAIVFQQHFRALKAMRTARNDYLLLKQATITVQCRFRAHKAMQEQHKMFLTQKQAATVIQHWWRANKSRDKQMEVFTQLKKSSIVIQRAFRAKSLMKKHRENYQAVYRATGTIQRSWRAIVTMRKIRKEYLIIRESTIVIQRRFRARQAMIQQRKEYFEVKSATIVVQQKWRATLLARKQRQEFMKIKEATMKIQRKFRATLEMRTCRENFLNRKRATQVISIRWRALLEMRVERKKFLQLKEATLDVQTLWRAILQGRKIRNEYQTLKSATITIQRRLRANAAMKESREKYCTLKKASTVIQARFRAQKAMKQAQEEYRELKSAVQLVQIRFRERRLTRITRETFLLQKSSALKIQRFYRSSLETRRLREDYLRIRAAAVVIQRRFRARLLMKKIRCQYLLIQSLVICLQRKFRAKRAMVRTREEFLTLKQATIFVQRTFRSKLEARRVRRNYLEAREKIVMVQAHVRGLLARRRFAAMMTPEAIELRRRVKAAKIIQCVWRGFITRKKKQTKLMRQISLKIINTRKMAKPADSVVNQVKMAMTILKGRFGLAETARVLTHMEFYSRTVPYVLIPHANFVAIFCYSVMADAIRSEPHKLIIESCARVMLNLARYRHTVEIVFLPDAFKIIAQMLLRWCDKQCGIFNTLCTLIWVFVQDPSKNRKIREFMVTHEALFMLREIRKLVLRKENMKTNVRRPEYREYLQTVSGNLRRTLPGLKPDFDVIQNQVYVFHCSVFAFDTILNKMNINLS